MSLREETSSLSTSPRFDHNAVNNLSGLTVTSTSGYAQDVMPIWTMLNDGPGMMVAKGDDGPMSLIK